MNTTQMLNDIRQEAEAILVEADKLGQVAAILRRLDGPAPAKNRSGSHHISAAGRRRISQAQKKRWRKVKRGK